MRNVRDTRTAVANGITGPASITGQRIRRLRTQSGKTLRAQAREIGIVPSSLARAS